MAKYPELGQTTEASIFEALIQRFSAREAKKHKFEEDVEEFIDLLSAAAFSMFNRGQQHVVNEALNTDLGTLVASKVIGTSERFSASTTGLIGHFFFVYKSRAQLTGRDHRTAFEFLHSTFGEYLVARWIAKRFP